jgi:hypothetical protein
MKFSLRTALKAISLLGIVLGMYVEHGLLGIGLLLPPTALAVGAAWLWRKALRKASILCVAFYLLAWASTEYWGTANFESQLETRICDILPNAPRKFRRIEYDPFLDRSRPRVPTPWYYLSRPHSPAPFVVYADYGWHRGPLCGYGGRNYALWCACWHPFASKPYWIS